MDFHSRIAHGYFFAKQYIINKGFASEIDWQDGLDFEKVNETKLLEEFTWVVLASGMNDKVVKKVFPSIKSIMYDFKSSELIYKRRVSCFNKALQIFNHPGKIKAILFLAEYVYKNSFGFIKSKIATEGIEFIQTLPYMGQATSFHLAKNLGIEVAKPDRHLNRIAKALGFKGPSELCKQLSITISEKASLIDLVLWRYATLDKKYLKKVCWLIRDID